MGWFEEQIKQRKNSDDNAFSETFYRIADSVTGDNIAKTIKNNRDRTLGAIAEIISGYGLDVIELNKEFDNVNDEIEYLCRPCGVMHRAVKLEGKWYKDAFSSYISVDQRTGNIVALIPDKISGKYKYFEVESGKYIKINRKNASFFEGEAICFYKPLPLRKLTLKDMFKYGISMWSVKDIILPLILIGCLTLLGLLGPKLSHFLFNEVYTYQNIGFLISTVIFLLCVSISRLLTNTVHTIIVAKNRVKTNVGMEAAVMMRVLSLPTSFFKKFSSGEILQRVEYANGVCGIIIEFLFDGGVTAVLSLVYIFQMVKYGPGLVIPGIIVIILTVLITIFSNFIGIIYTKKEMVAASKESGVAYSLISGVQKIKLAGAEKRAFSIWGHKYAAIVDERFHAPLSIKYTSVVTMAFSLIGIILIYFFSVKTSISVADYYAFTTAYSMVLGALSSLIGIAQGIFTLKPTKEMIQPILDIEPEASYGKKLVAKLSGNIELNNVTFAYEAGQTPVLNNLSLKIRSGQYVAIVGKTGCGKSTLVRVLLGFEKPQRGAIYYDGKDLNGLDLKSLRSNIGTVMQDGKLFQGDIFSNITVAAPYLTLDDAWEAAALAGMAEDIEKMPMGMQTLISDGTGGISGGQRQRLMIARAVASKPKILIFDEATSALDNVTQKIVSDSLDSLHCTRIVVAHRLSTIRHCDRIIYLDEGKIVEDGTYDELIEKNGLFAELVNRQRLENE